MALRAFTTRILAVSALGLAMGLSALVSATPAMAQARKVPESLMTAAADGAPQRVIIVLATPAQGGRQEAARNPERYIENTLRGAATMVSAVSDTPMVVAEVSGQGLERLAQDASVRQVFPDTLMSAFLPESTRMLHTPPVWEKTTRGKGAAVAVLDTGVQRDHPFLAGRIVAEACFSSASAAHGSQSLCPNGQSEQIGPGAGDACDPKRITPNCVHGTHVAGIVAGAGGGTAKQPLEGVAPEATIVAVQVFSRFSGEQRCGKGKGAGKGSGQPSCINAWTSDVIRGLTYVERIARQHNVAAVNLSLGGGRRESACDQTSAYGEIVQRLTQEGVAVIAAAGNNAFVGAVAEPACVSAAITVGAVGKDGAIDVRYSNSAAMVDLVAPGTRILSSAAGDYQRLDGTSMAAPHVAGLFALLRTQFPSADVATLTNAIQAGGQDVTDRRNGLAFVLPNAEAAFTRLAGDGSAPSPAPAPSPMPNPATPVAGCGGVCVEEVGQGTRLVFELAGRSRLDAKTLQKLRAAFGAGAKVQDMGNGKLSVELPGNTARNGADGRPRIDDRPRTGGGSAPPPASSIDALQPGGRITIQ